MREPALISTDPITCYHGGAFFQAIGASFDRLERRHDVVNADVLDAWFPPAPGVLEALRTHLDWLVRTSPPTNCEGMIRAIAEARGLSAECILPGAGSSDLIFRAFRHWLEPDSRVLLLDPTYGEYAHVCINAAGCRIERLRLDRESNYEVDPEHLHSRLQFGDIDLAVIVNPNNPTGQHLRHDVLTQILRGLPSTTLAWIDEAYVDYVGVEESLEAFAITRPNVVVCKSLSKAYALSGMRAAYLVGCSELLEPLRAWTPPWIVGLPAQVAAVEALRDAAYYQARYRATAELRCRFAARLRREQSEWDIVEGAANFVLCHLDPDGPSASEVVARCRSDGVFLRDPSNMGTNLGSHILRIAVKEVASQERILNTIAQALAIV